MSIHRPSSRRRLNLAVGHVLDFRRRLPARVRGVPDDDVARAVAVVEHAHHLPVALNIHPTHPHLRTALECQRRTVRLDRHCEDILAEVQMVQANVRKLVQNNSKQREHDHVTLETL